MEVAFRGMSPQHGIGAGVPQEERQPFGKRKVVKQARFFPKVDIAGRGQDGRIGRDHGFGKRQAGGSLRSRQSSEAIHIGFLNRPKIGLLQKLSEQAFGIVRGVYRDDLELRGIEAFAWGLFFEGQIAEKRLVAGSRSFVPEWPFHFHPLEGDTGCAALCHQGVPEVVGARSIEAGGIRDKCLPGQQPHFTDIVNGGSRGQIEAGYTAVQNPFARVDVDGFVTLSGTHGFKVRQMAAGGGQRCGPDRITGEFDAVATGNGRMETVPRIPETGHVIAADPAHGLLFPGIRAGHGARFGPDVALPF